MMHDKIGPHHLERKAILYVRQSSAHQVLHNRESGTLQYAMRDRLAAASAGSRIETIDDDPRPVRPRWRASHVPASTRMVAEVCLGKVGAVAARGVSVCPQQPAIGSSSIEMCRVRRHRSDRTRRRSMPRVRGNDRLLLGLKGSLNEYLSLNLLRQRSTFGPPREGLAAAN